MKKMILALAALLFFTTAEAQNIASYSADKLMQRASNNDTVYIINFWATWCIPCVQELPAFNTLQQKYMGSPVKIILVSLDFKESYPNKIAAFIQKKKLLPEVVWFNETDANKFIPKIDDSWSGSLPATFVIQKSKAFRWFKEGTVTEKQVGDIVDIQLAPVNSVINSLNH